MPSVEFLEAPVCICNALPMDRIITNDDLFMMTDEERHKHENPVV